jgi:Phosphotransferase enzyme family
MANPDSSCLPLVEVELDQIQALLSPVLKGAAIAGVERVEGGLTNTLYRITPADRGVSLCLRIFAAGRLPWERELKILARVSASLPVPAPLMANCGEADFGRPYLVYKWIEGITLSECRRQTPPAELLSVAEPLGRLLADVANFSLADDLNGATNDVHEGQSPMELLLSANEEALLHGLARKRLGAALADAMWSVLPETFLDAAGTNDQRSSWPRSRNRVQAIAQSPARLRRRHQAECDNCEALSPHSEAGRIGSIY